MRSIKKIIYRLMYSFYCVWYKNKKIKMPLLEVWVGQTCTLKCKDCLHMIPYIKPRLYEIATLIEDLKKILLVCDIEYLSIVGGEPFTNRDIATLINFINQCNDIPKAKIITNGTIMLTNEQIHLLASSSKIEVHIDQYPSMEMITEKLYLTLKNNGVKCELYHYDKYEEMRWKYLGENQLPRRNLRKAIKSHSYCAMNRVYTLSDGIFTSCPRGITTEQVYGEKGTPFEYVKLSEIVNSTDAKGKLAVCICGIYKEYCRRCLGVTRNNKYSVKPGIQMK